MHDRPYIRWTVHINDSIVPFEPEPAIRSEQDAFARAEAVSLTKPGDFVRVYAWVDDDTHAFTDAHLVAGFRDGGRVPDQDLIRD